MPEIDLRLLSKVYPNGRQAVRELDLKVADGEFLCILGPSGCGKSSTLRMLAGLERPSAGEIFLDGKRITAIPSRARNMAMVFENYALYPHLNVYQNIAMPLIAQHMGKREMAQRINAVCELLQLTEQLWRRPQTLSGGQRQRVALGRALVRDSRLFLMDEPLGHLEAYLRQELRAQIRRLHEEKRATTVYITHDQEEAGAVADRIAVMNDGRLQQLGSLAELTDRPANRFVAAFVGQWPINMLKASVCNADGLPALRMGETILPCPSEQAAALSGVSDECVEVGLRPDDVELVPSGTALALPGTVGSVQPQGEASIVVVHTNVGKISVLARSNSAPEAGAPAGVGLAGKSIHLFAAGGSNLLLRARSDRRG